MNMPSFFEKEDSLCYESLNQLILFKTHPQSIHIIPLQISHFESWKEEEGWNKPSARNKTIIAICSLVRWRHRIIVWSSYYYLVTNPVFVNNSSTKPSHGDFELSIHSVSCGVAAVHFSPRLVEFPITRFVTASRLLVNCSSVLLAITRSLWFKRAAILGFEPISSNGSVEKLLLDHQVSQKRDFRQIVSYVWHNCCKQFKESISWESMKKRC